MIQKTRNSIIHIVQRSIQRKKWLDIYTGLCYDYTQHANKLIAGKQNHGNCWMFADIYENDIKMEYVVLCFLIENMLKIET